MSLDFREAACAPNLVGMVGIVGNVGIVRIVRIAGIVGIVGIVGICSLELLVLSSKFLVCKFSFEF